jgi:hypothetical protein
VSGGVSLSRARVRVLLVGVSGVTLAAWWLAGLTGAGSAEASTLSQSTCQLASPYRHVVYVQFDNTHLARDNVNVPSDLEQIPNLKNFLVNNGTLLNNDHTILISHTAGGIVSSLTGLYPDRNGITESNSQIQYTNTNGTANAFPSAFSYWTDPTSTSDTAFNLITSPSTNTPAPWVPYTRAGCDVGAFSIANMELENTKTSSAGDITKVFGSGSPQANFANWSNNAFFSSTDPDGNDENDHGAKDGNLAVADFEGIAVHCAQADSGPSGLCGSDNGGQPDNLPSEPGGYMSFNGLFGASEVNQVTSKPGKFVASQIDDGTTANIGGTTGFADVAPPVDDVYGYKFTGCQYCAGGPKGPATSSPIADSTGNSGFPGFDPSAAQTLGYVASMQEAGIPVTFAYIADAHDDHIGCNNFHAMGPGQACYERQLAAYNQAFGAFFERLASDGITKANTLFVFTVDEGDHFAGGPPTNPGCDGVTVACTYSPSGTNSVGEQDVNLNNALARETSWSPSVTPFNIRFDDAPAFQVDATAADPGIPGPYDPRVRDLERNVSALTLVNQRTGQTDTVTQHIADQADLAILHMINADPLRTPSFVLFGNPDYFYQGGSCPPAASPGCPTVNPGFAWNHGDDNPEIARTWVGYVGPTIQNLGQTGSVWTDHTDLRPTMLEALGLKDDYSVDGNAVAQVLDRSSLSPSLDKHLSTYESLAATEAQLNAPFGEFGRDSEIVSTTAVESTSPGDGVAMGFDNQLNSCRTQRDAVVGQIQPMLLGAEFSGAPIDNAKAEALIHQADDLIGDMHTLSQMSTPPDSQVCAPSP